MGFSFDSVTFLPATNERGRRTDGRGELIALAFLTDVVPVDQLTGRQMKRERDLQLIGVVSIGGD